MKGWSSFGSYDVSAAASSTSNWRKRWPPGGRADEQVAWAPPAKRPKTTAVQSTPEPHVDHESRRCLIFLRGLPEGFTEDQVRGLYPQHRDKIVAVKWSGNGRNASVQFDAPASVQHALLEQPIWDGNPVRALPYVPDKALKELKKAMAQANEGIRKKKADAKLQPLKWDAATLRSRPVRRNLSEVLAKVGRTTDEAANEYRQEHRMTLFGQEIPNPCLSLKEAGFDADLLQRLGRQGIAAPLPIQAQCWPVLLEGHNCVAIAQTGSGKTLAYLLPAVMHIRRQRCPPPGPKEGPTVLIIAPTKELVLQIVAVALSLCPELRTCPIFGGADHVVQAAPLVTDGADIVVSTPRRLITFIQAGILTLRCVTFLVLDEAESTLFMGIGRQVRDIASQLRPDRQVSCFCATWSQPIQKKAALLMGDDLVRIMVNDMAFGAQRRRSACVNQAIQQNIIFLQTGKLKERVEHVSQLLKDLRMGGASSTQCMVFLNAREAIDQAAKALQKKLKKAHPVVVIHGGIPKTERRAALSRFQSHPHAILLATDIAARGLDIKSLPYVISMYLPSSYDTYVHRIGRTGRAGASGEAWALFDHDTDAKLAPELKEGIVRAGQAPP
eukprot:EG_transcript_6824